jgi:hypothetical protein
MPPLRGWSLFASLRVSIFRSVCSTGIQLFLFNGMPLRAFNTNFLRQLLAPRGELLIRILLRRKSALRYGRKLRPTKDTFFTRRMKRTTQIHQIAHCALFLLLLIASATGAWPQTAKQATAQPAPAQPASQSGASLPPLQLDGNEVLHHLNQVISWYRHSTTVALPNGHSAVPADSRD